MLGLKVNHIKGNSELPLWIGWFINSSRELEKLFRVLNIECVSCLLGIHHNSFRFMLYVFVLRKVVIIFPSFMYINHMSYFSIAKGTSHHIIKQNPRNCPFNCLEVIITFRHSHISISRPEWNGHHFTDDTHNAIPANVCAHTGI